MHSTHVVQFYEGFRHPLAFPQMGTVHVPSVGSTSLEKSDEYRVQHPQPDNLKLRTRKSKVIVSYTVSMR